MMGAKRKMVIYVEPKDLKKKVKCKDCGKEFEVNPRARYARKYCKKCSAKRKKDYENLWKVKAEDCDEGGGGW
tara:strand:- start:5991 stop:6209 length:219 start_codon:yes stop_codon:yes gene_type:complete